MNSFAVNAFRWSPVALILLLASGCNSQAQRSAFESQAIVLETGAGIKQIVSVPMDFQHIIDRDGKSCVMAHPGMLLSTSNGIAVGNGNSSISDNTGVEGTFASEAGMKQAELIDVALFRLCEMGLNYNISSEDYLEMFNEIVQFAEEDTGQD